MSKPLFKKSVLAVAVATALTLSAGVNAAYTVPGMPALVSGSSTDPQAGFPTDWASWQAAPEAYAWNPINVAPGEHPDRPDGVVYIFPDAASADAWNGVGVPDDATAYIHTALDNDSGLFPGIMAITDDKKFKTNNCVMSSGVEIPAVEDDPASGMIPKTCSNYRGSAKRLKLVVLKADTPIDIVFNTANQDLVYDNYDEADIQDPGADGILGTADDPLDDVFRIYRYIMKWGNGTGTDSVSEVRDGDRIVGFKVQLGKGVGDDPLTGFTQFTDLATDGIGYELRLCIADPLFDTKSSQSSPGTSDCPAGEVELWLPNEFATYSPSMYSLNTDKRTAPIGGYWDKAPSGIFPPAVQLENEIDAGTVINGPIVGATQPNYFDISTAQAAGADPAIPANVFAYMMHYGVFADGDPGIISSGIYLDDDGDPATEGGLFAWWDGTNYRWGIDPDYDGEVGTADPNGVDAWDVVSDTALAYMASRQLDEHQVLEPPRFEVGYMDDLGGLNVDTFIRLQENFDTTVNPTFTIRMVAQSAESAGQDVPDGPWVANPPPPLDDFAVEPPPGDEPPPAVEPPPDFPDPVNPPPDAEEITPVPEEPVPADDELEPPTKRGGGSMGLGMLAAMAGLAGLRRRRQRALKD